MSAVSRRILLILTLLSAAPAQADHAACYRRLPISEYRDKVKAGWLGQMAGVSWGAPTEFKHEDRIIPENAMPTWKPAMINDAFAQDDLYVEMTFLRSMEQYGFDVSIRRAGIDFANTRYTLWCANDAARKNLRKGIAPPDSSHPAFTLRPNDIDYQIEADYSGLIAPGMPNVAIALGEKFGRLMNYGDGMYAGQFIGAMYAEAFFQTNVVTVVERALKAIPAGSQYAEMVRDMLRWSKQTPNWHDCRRRCREKYRLNPEYQRCSNGSIDCKINGAYVLMGLLYGAGDLDKTITISCRCGMDSDCNPSSSAGVLGTMLGFSSLPAAFSADLDQTTRFVHTAYDFPTLLNVCERLARQVVVREGGRVEKGSQGDEFVIPVKPPKPSELLLSWAPGPIANSRYTDAEMAEITTSIGPLAVKEALSVFAPQWELTVCGTEMNPGMHPEALGRKNVLVTHPFDSQTPCLLTSTPAIPAGKKTVLKLTVGHHPQGNWNLQVKADHQLLYQTMVGPDTARSGWLDVSVDLTEYAGHVILLQLLNQATGSSCQAGYWASIAIESK